MRAHTVGGAGLVRTSEGLRFYLPEGGGRYANVQLDDHTGLRRRAFPWRPQGAQAITLEVRARFSHMGEPYGAPHPLRGTAGFGFWNDPFGMGGTWPPALPQAAWFFYAGSDSNLPLALDVPGCGWKAAVLDAGRAPALGLLPAAPVAPLLLRRPRLYRAIWPTAQRALGVAEHLIHGPMTAWRDYRLEWRTDSARFWVDGALVLEAPCAPRGPLGLVIWMDTQYLMATPQGRLGAGVVRLSAPQWMELASVQVGPCPTR